MTEQPLTNRAQLEADLDAERSILNDIAQRVSTEFVTAADALPPARAIDIPAALTHPGTVELFGGDGPLDAVTLTVDYDAQGTPSWQLEQIYPVISPDWNPDPERAESELNPTEVAGTQRIDVAYAAEELDVPEADMRAAIEAIVPLITEHADDHRAWAQQAARVTTREDEIRRLLEQDYAQQAAGSTPEASATTEQMQQPAPVAGAEQEWATDALDEPFTPERVAADWIQSTTMVKAYLEADRPDLARDWINELDENLRAYRDGEAAPGSDEAESVYHDAVARNAIPYGTSPLSPDEVRQQLAGLGEHVAPLDVQGIRETTAITPLDSAYVTSKLDEATHLPTGLEDVAAARLDVRRAIASISEDSEAAQEYLQTANTRLGQVVEQLRTDQAHEGVLAVQESVQQASQKVAAVADTAAKVEAEVSVYSLPDCVGCAATKRALDKAGVEYDEIPLQEHPDLVARFKQQGLAQAPIVETSDGDRWAGFNPGKLKEHGLDHRTRQQRTGGHDRDTGQGR